MVKIKAVPVQHGAKGKKHQLFVGSIKIKDIIDLTKIIVDYWRPEDKGKEDQGYQRLEVPAHVKKIKKVVLENGTDFPTTLLMSYRKLQNRLPSFTYDKNTCELVFNEYPIYLVDGQHRTAGVRSAFDEYVKNDPSLGEKEVGVSVMIGLDKFEEMEYFETINSTPKKVETGLANELLVERARKFPHLMKSLNDNHKSWMVKGDTIIHKLNDLEGSPWYGVVKMPNKKYDKNAKAVAGFGQLLQSLKTPLNSGLKVYKLDDCARIVNEFWSVLRDLFPDSFTHPRDYVIQKTPGMFSLHMLLDYILAMLGSQGKIPSKENFRIILEQLFENIGVEGFKSKNDNSRFWQSGNSLGASMYRGQAGFKSLYTKFVEDGLDGTVD